MTTPNPVVSKYPVVSYFTVAFAVSWGALIAVVGPGGFTGTTEPTSAQLPFVFLAMFAGPTVAGILLTGLVDGKAGLRDLRSRLFTWRVDSRWYAVAVLAAPLLMMATLLALSRTNPAFLPGIFTADDKVSLLMAGISAGLVTGVCEELGWTGFAIPRLRLRRGVLATGISVGMLWGAWHLPLFAGGDPSGAVPRALFVCGLLFTVLPAFRVLMVWVYDRTGSLLVAMLMHASLTASTLILQPGVAGVPAMIYNLVLAAMVYGVVGAVTMADGGRLSRQP